MILDENLTWDTHIDHLCRKIAKSIGVLYRARHYLNLDILKNLYFNLIYSYISYGTLVWGSNYKSKLRHIHLLQKRALRIMTFSHIKTPSRPLFQKLEILNIFEIVKLQLGEIAFKYSKDQLPSTFSKLFIDMNEVHQYSTRSKSNKNLYIPRKKLNYGQHGVQYAASKNWNEIPLDIKVSASNSIFKKKYRTFLLSSSHY